MLKDDPDDEQQLLEFIRPYFEEFHMKLKPLHPERTFDCFKKQTNLRKQLLALKKKPIKQQQTTTQKPKNMDPKPKPEEQINL